MKNTVKYLSSAMQGAPVVSNGFGDLIDMLDACLVNGFNLKPIESITRVDNKATATISTGHLYTVGQIIRIAGAVQASYNGDFEILETTSNSFSFDVTGSPATPATTVSSITIKTAPIGFEIAFTGVHKRAYRSPNIQGNRPFIRVDGSQLAGYETSWAKFCRVSIAQDMSDIDTFVGSRAPYDSAAPTKNEVKTNNGTDHYGWYKWYSAALAGGNTNNAGDGGTAARQWLMIGDDRGFHLFINPFIGNYGFNHYSAGEFTSFKQGDAFNCMLVSDSSFTESTNYYNTSISNMYNYYSSGYQNDNHPRLILCDYTQVGEPVAGNLFAISPSGQFTSGLGIVPFPNGPDYSLLISPSLISQAGGHVRGVLPGQYAILNGGSPYGNGTIVDNLIDYPDKRFLIVAFNSSGQNTGRVAFDLTGPWR